VTYGTLVLEPRHAWTSFQGGFRTGVTPTQGGADHPQSAHDRHMLDPRKCTIIILAAFSAGCHVGICAKRASENCCPTDIRKTVPWCAGEDAVFRCPCGPDGDFYGHKPTCWRTWPAPAAAWRDIWCGNSPICGTLESHEAPIPLPAPDAPLGPSPTPELLAPPSQESEQSLHPSKRPSPSASQPLQTAVIPLSTAERSGKSLSNSSSKRAMTASPAGRGPKQSPRRVIQPDNNPFRGKPALHSPQPTATKS